MPYRFIQPPTPAPVCQPPTPLPSKWSTCVVTVCFFRCVPRLKNKLQGSPSAGWDGSVCNRFPKPAVHAVIHITRHCYPPFSQSVCMLTVFRDNFLVKFGEERIWIPILAAASNFVNLMEFVIVMKMTVAESLILGWNFNTAHINFVSDPDVFTRDID